MEDENNRPNQHQPANQVKFTPTELKIIHLLCAEKTTEDIATELNIHKRTVDRHRQKLLTKTGSRGVLGIVRYAIEHGIVTEF